MAKQGLVNDYAGFVIKPRGWICTSYVSQNMYVMNMFYDGEYRHWFFRTIPEFLEDLDATAMFKYHIDNVLKWIDEGKLQ